MPTLLECKKLKHLFLFGNPHLDIPAEILGLPGQEALKNDGYQSVKPVDIINYYFRPKRSLFEAKLILVGRGAVGKTSLVNRLVHGTFDQVKKTEGIKITRWDVPLADSDHRER